MSEFDNLRGGGDATPVRPKGSRKALTRQSSSTTPLQKFVEIKSKINHIFQDIENYVLETSACLNVGLYPIELKSSREFVSQSMLSDVDHYAASVKTIREVLQRDRMKVVFFGRTSNGKSTVINTMLHNKVLPSGMGHTTRSFLQVESSPTGEKYILTEDSDEPKTIDFIDNLTEALCSKDIGEDSLVRIFLPKTDSKLLQNEVVLVDSPGIDVSAEFDSWIDKHCLDADVFVLVSNAESTLTQSEKSFFNRVNDKVSRPNLFILNNRWDASAAEPESSHKVREQHMKQFLRFLVDDLSVCTTEEAKHRCFFVSAREVLHHRLKHQASGLSPIGPPAEGFQARLLEFEDFERKFELCISQSAIRTKFEAHTEKGKSIAQCLHEILESLHSSAASENDQRTTMHKEKVNELRLSQSNFFLFSNEAKEKIQQLSDEVQLKVSTECYQEVLRLEKVINEFQLEFTNDPLFFDTYKQELSNHINEVVTNDLLSSCTGGLLERIIAFEREMVGDVVSIIPQNFASKITSLLKGREPFKFSFAVDCHSLLDDFREDLDFHYTFGLSSLIRRFLSFRRNRKFSSKGDEQSVSAFSVSQPGSFTTESESIESTSLDYGRSEDTFMESLMYSGATYVGYGGMGLLLVGGLVNRSSVGWRVAALGASAYFGLYLFERLRWNNRAKEKELKNQMRKHLASRLNQLSHSITVNCDGQVSKEVNEVLTRLQELVYAAHEDMKLDVEKLQMEIIELKKIAKSLAHTKGQATFLSSELDNFVSSVFGKMSPTQKG